MSTPHPIDTASDCLGSQAALAAVLGVTKAAVHQWKLEGRRVPLEHCVAIEQATNGWGLNGYIFYLTWTWEAGPLGAGVAYFSAAMLLFVATQWTPRWTTGLTVIVTLARLESATPSLAT